MDTLFELPIEVRLAVVFFIGAWIGGQVNRGIYRLAWNARQIGPWSKPHPDVPSRRATDRIPIFGWFGLRRELEIHGRGFWIRPLLLELALGCGLAALYYWENQGGLYAFRNRTTALPLNPIHWQFLSHSLLISLMTVATFIDFDEKTIPDEITVPGVLLGLLLAALVPISQLPVVSINLSGIRDTQWLHVAAPQAWPAWLNGVTGLTVGILCFAGWCVAILPIRWTTRRGWRKAFVYLIAGVIRNSNYKLMGAIFVFGIGGIAGTWSWGGEHWRSLLSALIGMAFGGVMIWSVRIVGSMVLAQEAMGFGDVTLMAMIGTYIGWQGSLLTFFLAPFAALWISITQWLLTRRKDIAFGPYLCAGAVIVIVAWRFMMTEVIGQTLAVWNFIEIMIILFVCLMLMGGLLSAWVAIRDRILFPLDSEGDIEQEQIVNSAADSTTAANEEPSSNPALETHRSE